MPFSVLYYAGVKYNAWRQSKKKTHSFSNLNIICVGNITAGGSGKTPLCIALSNLLAQQAPCIVTKGYKRKKTGTFKVQSLHTAEEVGDEALLMSEYGNVIVCNSRVEGCQLAEKLGFRTVILDDGLHDNSVQKDVNIITMHSQKNIGNGYLVPAGPLRSRIQDALQNIDAFVIIGGGELPAEITKNTHDDISSFSAYSHIRVPDIPKNKKIIAFTGIAHPDLFFEDLHNNSLTIDKKISFSDHHSYSAKDLEKLDALATTSNALLLTTHKDVVKIRPFIDEMQNDVYVAAQHLSIPESQRLATLCSK